jgi:hypothetical protein
MLNEVQKLMKEVADGGWWEATMAIRSLSEIALQHNVPPER